MIGEAPQEEDAERNTDLIVLRLAAVRIACRVRKYTYYANPEYRQQFTVRTDRPSGAKTELGKIIEGWGDYFFYGFSDQAQQSLVAWRLMKLNVFRLWFNQYMARNNGRLPGEPHENRDGTRFLAFGLSDAPEDLILSAIDYEGDHAQETRT